MKKAKEIMLSFGIAAFAMLAGAACYHQVLAADKPTKEVAPVQQQMEVTAYCYGKVAAIYLDNGGEMGEFLGYFEILDTGGDERIQDGLVLDIYIPDHDVCIEFGRQKVIVTIIDGEE